MVDNADLVLVIGPQNGHSRLMCERLATTSRSGLKYEDGGSLGFVVAESGEEETGRATLALHCSSARVVAGLADRLGSNCCPGTGRPCTPTEHRALLLQTSLSEGGGGGGHGTLLAGLQLPAPTGQQLEDGEPLLRWKAQLAAKLLAASRNTVVFSDAEPGELFLSGALYGAKCGMGREESWPGEVHYQGKHTNIELPEVVILSYLSMLRLSRQ